MATRAFPAIFSSQGLSCLSFRPPSRQRRPLPHQGRKQDRLRADVMSEVGSVYGSPKCFQDKDKMFDEDEMFDSEQVDVGEAGQSDAIYEL